MKVFSIWRCTGSAGVRLSVESGKDMNGRLCRCSLQCEPVSVPKEVAEFLDQERKREQAQDKRDERHLSRSEFETVLSCLGNTDPPVEETAIQALQLETLRKAVQKLDAQEQNLVALRYGQELTMEEIGRLCGISKMAVSKRLRRLHEKLRSSVT